MSDATNVGKIRNVTNFENMSPLLRNNGTLRSRTHHSSNNKRKDQEEIHQKFDLPVKRHRNILDSVRDKNLKTNLENIHKSPLLCKAPVVSTAASAFPSAPALSASKQLDFNFEDVQDMSLSMRAEPFVDILGMCQNFDAGAKSAVHRQFGMRSPNKSPSKNRPTLVVPLEKSPPIPIISPPKRLNHALKLTADSVASSAKVTTSLPPRNHSPQKKSDPKIYNAFEKFNHVLSAKKYQNKPEETSKIASPPKQVASSSTKRNLQTREKPKETPVVKEKPPQTSNNTNNKKSNELDENELAEVKRMNGLSKRFNIEGNKTNKEVTSKTKKQSEDEESSPEVIVKKSTNLQAKITEFLPNTQTTQIASQAKEPEKRKPTESSGSMTDFIKKPGVVVLQDQAKPNKVLVMRANIPMKRKCPNGAPILIDTKFMAAEEAKQSSIDYSSILSMSRSSVNEATETTSGSLTKLPRIMPTVNFQKAGTRVDMLKLICSNAPS
jgi:hypothetical protein